MLLSVSEMFSSDLFVEEAKRRAEIFRNLDRHLRAIAGMVRELDHEAEVYLFGSVAEGKHMLSSDIDILVVTNRKPGETLATLWSKGVKEPFEIHVVTKDMLEIYRRKAILVKIKP